MKTFEQCKKEVAVKYKLGSTLVTGHLSKYWEEAGKEFARSACKKQRELCAEHAEVHYPASNNLNPTVNPQSILNAQEPDIFSN